ncbi:dehydrogenase/reductase SDR family member 12-like isoform X3 [Papaver somniferum]|uniref:dehydrogenase/reductase SDR family member 12-like isoform X3 n=1 Tax=Papaver somniferum TaxID=3469 RepID=UPI000E6FF604|nr:dehydrogenase/reductase SDR family member 12-like isoform X3 [Papaver somniferum]
MFLQKAWRTAAFGVFGYLNFTKSGFIEHTKKFKEDEMKIRIDGKNCVVTGANSGIGYAVAEALASSGGNVYMVCRNKERGEAAVSKVQSATGNQNVYLEVNNAGLIDNNRTTTPEGLEMNFAVNVAGTFCITELMLPLLEKATPDARVITVSSGGMYTSPLTVDLQFSESKFDGVLQYARNKRVQVALTEKWAELHKNKGIGFYSMHPGWAETPGVAQSLPDFSERMSGKLRTSEEGADTIVWLALQPKEKLVSGSFYFDRAEAPKHLPFAGTSGSHDIIDSIVDRLYSLCDISK